MRYNKNKAAVFLPNGKCVPAEFIENKKTAEPVEQYRKWVERAESELPLLLEKEALTGGSWDVYPSTPLEGGTFSNLPTLHGPSREALQSAIDEFENLCDHAPDFNKPRRLGKEVK